MKDSDKNEKKSPFVRLWTHSGKPKPTHKDLRLLD